MEDKLIYFDGESIFYDALGNPTSCRGNSLTWEKGQIEVFSPYNNKLKTEQ